MELTPNLQLPTILAAQSQKHVTHNEALMILDAVAQLSVLDRGLVSPPASPANGGRYIVPASPTGAWSGHAGHIATWQDGAWVFYTPREGWIAWVADEDILVAWNGSTWVTAGGGGTTSLNPAMGGLVGVNATADTTNRMVVASPASLFSHEGAGHQLKVNKATAGNTASVLFQTEYSGRAECGLTDDDNWHVKVSADGVTWFEALIVDRATGKVSMPLTPSRDTLAAARTYYVRVDGSDSNTGLSNSAGGAFRNIQKSVDTVSVDTVAALDLSVHNVTIQVGAGTYTEEVVLKPLVGAGLVTLQGDDTTPANVVIQSTGDTSADVCINADGISGSWRVSGFKLQGSATGNRLVAVNKAGTKLTLGAMDYGQSGNSHISVSNGAACTVDSNYTISGRADYHINVLNAAIDFSNRTITLSGTPSLGYFILCARVAYARAVGCTFVGGANGTRYDVNGNAVVFTGGAGSSYFPGSVAGSISTGGQLL